MDDGDKIKTIFTHSNLPPLYGDNFLKNHSDWKRLSGIEFDTLGVFWYVIC